MKSKLTSTTMYGIRSGDNQYGYHNDWNRHLAKRRSLFAIKRYPNVEEAQDEIDRQITETNRRLQNAVLDMQRSHSDAGIKHYTDELKAWTDAKIVKLVLTEQD